MEIVLADNLRKLRQENGYSLEALAQIVDVSRQSVAKWEMGESVPDLGNCLKLASLYKVTLDELVSLPMRSSGNVSDTGDKYYCSLPISEEHTIKIPEEVMRIFALETGDRLLMLADLNQGIALVKCSREE
ncbi:MAG: helix-turn-helix transcriptional regulator [Eubacteriaceae bacterium]|nr:helix-turn-helix transcriptional regulator [Eubacteriaceae bacterium]MBR2781104.1 helix-turn-helix transcriptional regulator [Eubacteriaceae bacterium]MCR4894233.1 helix-turn-helix domain-containing protein [Eubacteriales bacterium]